MKSSNIWGRVVGVAAMLLLVAGVPAFAQLQSGNLYGTVVDEQGTALPGVTVTLTGGGAPQVQVTNAQGQFRFLGLAPESYAVKAELEGFSTIEYPNIRINVGRNTTIEITLTPAVEEVITVTAESPLLDERKISTGATVTQTELEKIPTSRDPWAVLQQVPGVLTDRINVGGNESGQQSQYIGPGSGGDQAVWAVDGVNITDMAATGSSPTYYDFDSFEEMQVTTGGSDVSLPTGGVVLNMVTKRGTNEWRGSGRYLVTDNSWQSTTSFDSSKLGTGQRPFKAGNRIVEVLDYGAELGGPVVRDRLWIWGAYGKQDIELLTVSDVSDATELDTYNAKVNAQLSANNSATGFFLYGDKIKNGRNAGPTRPQETTWNQTGPTEVYKLEDTHIFSANFFLTGLASLVESGFQLAPQGGLDITPVLDQTFVWHNSFLLYDTDRPQTQYRLDGSNFFNTGGVSHELKFGVGYREAEVASLSRWPGAGIQLDYYRNYVGYGYPEIDAGASVVQLSRDAFPAYTLDYSSVYAQDTLTVGNLTANLGLRYDIQDGTLDPRQVRANSIAPQVLPAISYAGGDIGFEWESITPRLGLTYALGQERKTLLRASYAQFADQLGSTASTWLNPLYPGAYVYAYYTDLNGNGQVEASEVGGPCNACSNPFNQTYNPFNPGVALQSNAVDPNLDPPLTHEVLLSGEHAFLPEFVVGLNLTYRLITDILETEDLVFDGDPRSATNVNLLGRVATRADYVPVTRTGTLPNGQPYTVTFYNLAPGIGSRGGQLLRNGDREQTYEGASLTFNKRLSNRWMLRGNFTVSNWEWDTPESELEDRTNTIPGSHDGDPVLQGSGTGSGSKGAIYINSNWSYSVNGLYQIAPDRPWGFNVAANLTGREGYPIPNFRRFTRPGLGSTNVLIGRADDFRNPDVHLLDARVEKEFTFSDFGLTLGVDVFNVTNEAYVLQREHRQGVGTSGFVREILSPRIFRIGARFSFR